MSTPPLTRRDALYNLYQVPLEDFNEQLLEYFIQRHPLAALVEQLFHPSRETLSRYIEQGSFSPVLSQLLRQEKYEEILTGLGSIESECPQFFTIPVICCKLACLLQVGSKEECERQFKTYSHPSSLAAVIKEEIDQADSPSIRELYQRLERLIETF